MAATSYEAAACRKKGAAIKPSEKTKNDGFFKPSFGSLL